MEKDVTCGDSIANCEFIMSCMCRVKHSHSLFTFMRVVAENKNESFTIMPFAKGHSQKNVVEREKRRIDNRFVCTYKQNMSM